MIKSGVIANIQLGSNLYSLSTTEGDTYGFFVPVEFGSHRTFELILYLEKGNGGIFPSILIDAIGDLICTNLMKHPNLVFYYGSNHNGIGTIEDLISRYIAGSNRQDIIFLRDHHSSLGLNFYYGFLFSENVPMRVNLESQFKEIKNNL